FGFTDAGAIEASVCDLGTPAGQAGPAGGTPAAPVCEHGTPLRTVGTNKLAGEPYLTIQPADPTACEYEGAYPAAATVRGGPRARAHGPAACVPRTRAQHARDLPHIPPAAPPRAAPPEPRAQGRVAARARARYRRALARPPGPRRR